MRPDATLPWKRMTMSLEPNTSQNKATKHSKWHQPVRVDSPPLSSLMPMDSQLVVLLYSIQIYMSQNWTGTRNRYQGGSNDRFRWVNWLCCKLRSGQVLSWYLQCFSNKKSFEWFTVWSEEWWSYHWYPHQSPQILWWKGSLPSHSWWFHPIIPSLASWTATILAWIPSSSIKSIIKSISGISAWEFHMQMCCGRLWIQLKTMHLSSESGIVFKNNCCYGSMRGSSTWYCIIMWSPCFMLSLQPHSIESKSISKQVLIMHWNISTTSLWSTNILIQKVWVKMHILTLSMAHDLSSLNIENAEGMTASVLNRI